MARRAKKSDGMNLDSLMDALTNVVGILVIVLVLTSLDVSSAVKRIKQVRPEDFGISEAELTKTQEQVDASQAEVAAQTQNLADLNLLAVQTELDEKQRQIDRIKNLQVPDPDDSSDEEKLRDLIEERKQKSKQLEEQLAQAQNELQKLKGMLDDAPVVSAPPSKIVKVPNPRSAPKGIQPIYFVCRDGRVLLFLPGKLKERAEKRLQFLLRPLQNKAGPNGEIDCNALVEGFNRSKINDANYRVQLTVQNFNLYLQYTYQGGGETTDKLAARSSKYQAALRKIDPQKYYCSFLVWPDSFDAYVEARRVCDEYDLLAGWTPHHKTYEWRTGLAIKVACEGKPKPPPPKPRPPGEPAPPPPKPLPNDQID